MTVRGAMVLILALASGRPLPDLPSPEWTPELEPTLRSMVKAEVVMLTELLAAPPSGT